MPRQYSNVDMATFYHATDVRNLKSIRARGLRVGMSRQKRKAVWFVGIGDFNWACKHAAERNGGALADVVVIQVDIPRDWVRHHGGGLWYCDRNVPAARITGVHSFRMEFSA
jgi:hypothetical protein